MPGWGMARHLLFQLMRIVKYMKTNIFAHDLYSIMLLSIRLEQLLYE